MDYIAIDAGTYAIKFITFTQDKKTIAYKSFDQVKLEGYLDKVNEQYTIRDLQEDIILAYLEEKQLLGKIITQIPNELITTRSLTIPIKNRKKAEQVIPFQLEEDLPYNSEQFHLSKMLIPIANGFHVIVCVCNVYEFEEYYNHLQAKKFIPKILTSPPFLYQTVGSIQKLDRNFAIIDVGHTTTNAYFFHHKNLVSTHISFIAGKIIDEVISESYKISLAEAVKFKHDNSFLLQEDKLDEVDEDQREFAKIMSQILSPLLDDIRKWELGYRVQYGMPIEKIYFTGGSSNISNFNNYFYNELGIKTGNLNTYLDAPENIPSDKKELRNFEIANMMAVSLNQKVQVGNFLTGEYGSSDFENIPVHSTAFIGARLFIIFFIFLLSFVAERMLLNNQVQKYDAKITRVLKNPDLEISKSKARKYKRAPRIIHRLFKGKQRQIDRDIKAIQDASRFNVVEPLMKLGAMIGPRKEFELHDYTSSLSGNSATFFSTKPGELGNLEKLLRSSSLNISNLEKRPDQSKIVLEFR